MFQPECGVKVSMWIEKGLIQFPTSPKKNPTIMIGPGTGCAAFRAFIQQRVVDAIGGELFGGFLWSGSSLLFKTMII